LADADDYDKIFAALKNPIRRQILLVLEEKGEMSFTNLQEVVGISDTGLMSYHLKELSSLVEQSERGRYRLSETGKAGVVLFQKVETQRNRETTVIHRELRKIMGEIFFFFIILGISWGIPASVDILLSVQGLSQESIAGLSISLSLIGLLGLLFGIILFTLYDRHYFSKRIKTNVIHSTLFASIVTLLMLSSFNFSHSFMETAATGSISNNNLVIWTWVFILRTVVFLGCTPVVTYSMSRFLNKRRKS
jgi:DNA-binding transcriptional ArsR family regulator